MEFKKLELEPEGSWIKRKISNPHFKKSVIYMVIGAILGLVFFFVSEGVNMDNIQTSDIGQYIFFGAFMGFFITNSPCSRGKC